MSCKKKKKKVYGQKTKRPYEVRDYFAKKLIDDNMSIERFNKIWGIKNKEQRGK